MEGGHWRQKEVSRTGGGIDGESGKIVASLGSVCGNVWCTSDDLTCFLWIGEAEEAGKTRHQEGIIIHVQPSPTIIAGSWIDVQERSCHVQSVSLGQQRDTHHHHGASEQCVLGLVDIRGRRGEADREMERRRRS